MKLTSLILATLLAFHALLPAQDSKRSPATPGSPGAVKTENRCQAKTKAGHQCKRQATPGSHYCWQHGGKKK